LADAFQQRGFGVFAWAAGVGGLIFGVMVGFGVRGRGRMKEKRPAH
jgi:hypothetical protein